MIKKILIGLLAFSSSAVFAEDDKNTVIINNKATAQQAVTAPTLVPSPATKMREVRERQEVTTEDMILKELEKQRLLDEQKRIDRLFGNQNATAPEKNVVVTSVQPQRNWIFGSKSFISFGAGVVSYPGVTNVNSTENPAGFISFGGYGYNGNVILDLAVYYSRHYLKTPNRNYNDVREVVDQPALAMAVKFSPLKGQVKPYVGVSGSVIWRKWGFVDRSGASLESEDHLDHLLKDVSDKTWNQAVDAGVAMGADIALGSHLGLNLDVRYHVNLYTENRKTAAQILTDEEILDERNSLIMSGSLRYYF